MEQSKTPQQSLMDYVIQKATAFADASYPQRNEAMIAAKAFAVGYEQAHREKTKELKELAGIVKLLLPGLSAVSPEELKRIENYIEKADKS